MWKKQKSQLDTRLRELEAEAEAVRSSIRELSKAVESGDPVSPETSSAPSVPSPIPGVGEVQPSLQITSSESRALLETNTNSGYSMSGGSSILGSENRSGDRQLGRYLQTTGLSSERPRRQERSVQRNKAIFMVVIVLIVLYVVLTKFF